MSQSLPCFDLVVTSELSWAYETTIAMGYLVDKRINSPAYEKEEADEDVCPTDSLADYANLIKTSSGIAKWANAQADYYLSIIEVLPEEDMALIISHGGTIDAAAVACYPHADHRSWGPTFGCCEGYKLTFENDKFMNIELRRINTK
jgi:hypothetical protein